MAFHRTIRTQGESLLEWTVSHNVVDRHIADATSAKVSLRQAREASQWLHALVLLCLVSLLAFLYLALASSVAREIETTATLETNIQSMKEANNKLRLEIVLKEDLTRIQQEAKAMGFVTPQHMEYLEVVLKEPLAPTDTSGGGQPLPMTGTSSTPGWWDRLVGQFRDWVTNAPKAEPRDSP